MLHAQKHEGTWNHIKHMMTIVLYTKSMLIQVNWTGLFIRPTRALKPQKNYFYNGSNELCRLWVVPLQNHWYVSIAFTHHRPTVYSSRFCIPGPPALECATLKSWKWVCFFNQKAFWCTGSTIILNNNRSRDCLLMNSLLRLSLCLSLIQSFHCSLLPRR